MSNKIEALDFSKLPIPNIIIPKKLEISNIEKAKSDKVKIDWKNKPKEKEIKFDLFSLIKLLGKSIESFFKPLIDKITEYIREPDRVVITDTSITEFYGEKKITYRLNKDRDKFEVYRED